jgi:Uma2 family endonuclease
MAKPQPKPWTLDDFLAWEASQEDKFELIDGIIYAMAGGTVAHATIAVNLLGLLSQKLRGTGCRPFTSDMKVIGEYFSAYPDVSVVCSRLDDQEITIDKPVVVAEVTSSSTRPLDIGPKWESYREIPALQHYLLIDQDRCRVEPRSRDGAEWRIRICESPTDEIELSAINVAMTVAELYENVSLPRRRP